MSEVSVRAASTLHEPSYLYKGKVPNSSSLLLPVPLSDISPGQATPDLSIAVI